MNKLILVIILALAGFAFILQASKDNEPDLNKSFSEWDSGRVDVSKGFEIMKSLEDYIANNPDYKDEDILELSPFLKIYKKEKIKIIEYIENPVYYGSSGKGSYHIVLYENGNKIIESNGSIIINDIISIDDNTYYIYVTDYKFSNITGINIYEIVINNNIVEFESILSTDIAIDGFVIIADSLYYDNAHINYHNINCDEVFIQINDKYYELKMNNDGNYKLIGNVYREDKNAKYKTEDDFV